MALQIFEIAKNNSFLAFGLGEGCGIMFPYLSQDTKDRLSARVSIDGFALGFGVGIGKIRRYLESSIFEEASSFTKSMNFMKGFAIGLGSTVVNLSGDPLVEILSRSAELDGSFARNFGFGIGHIFSLLEEDKRNEIIQIMRQTEENFLVGLGEDLGHSMPSTGSRLVEEVMQTIGSVNLAQGAARGATESFTYLNLAEVLRILEYASFNSEYGKVLGEGLADKFVSLDEEKQSWILDALQKDSHFSKMFAKMVQKNHDYLSSETRERIKDLDAKFPHFEVGLEKEE